MENKILENKKNLLNGLCAVYNKGVTDLEIYELKQQMLLTIKGMENTDKNKLENFIEDFSNVLLSVVNDEFFECA
ncbi:hypothetical protein HMPREF0202_01347 [Cetobacterium somerae ATCC BAA-474]|uniref:Uncharacterized protein n=1 Tax=Cetobacterium somerae ATCC BAA-474 TaxID=1319815 RepID=U7VD95_9FUSO|nr:hypothetical protein [Cetobacterium somerae]ERT68748.1 hypothetical protein HMPREF0202_01347 [Cetobacterium somerae ATCC BAA-474]